MSQEGDLPLFGPADSLSLGAPFAGNQNDFPLDRGTYWVGGKLARIFGLFPAANMMMIGCHLLAALSFYWAARLWRISRVFSWSFAIIYSTLPQFTISLNYFGFLSFGLLPLQLYICWYIAVTKRVCMKSNRFKLALFVGGLSGFLHVYWIFLFFQLYLLALVRRLFTGRSNLGMAQLPFLVTIIVFIIASSCYLFFQYRNGENHTALTRTFKGIELCALKVSDIFIPMRGNAFSLLTGFP